MDEAGDTIFQSSAFSNWASYVSELNSKRSTDAVLRDTISVLLKRFEEPDLAKLLFTAKHRAVRDAEINIISDLQRLQFKKWQEQGESTESVATRLLTIGADRRNRGIIGDYNNFLKGIKY